MSVEYILLLALFVFLMMGALIGGPENSFTKAGPRLGARVEKHLITGYGFGKSSGSGASPLRWE